MARYGYFCETTEDLSTHLNCSCTQCYSSDEVIVLSFVVCSCEESSDENSLFSQLSMFMENVGHGSLLCFGS